MLFVNKFESLCRTDARFSEAYKVCQEQAGKTVSVDLDYAVGLKAKGKRKLAEIEEASGSF